MNGLALAATVVTISASTAGALMLGGVHIRSPDSSGTPTVAQTIPEMVVQAFNWPASADATGYRLYMDGKVISLVNYTNAMIAVKCGVKHRFNAQPFNNKGVSALAPPVYFTPSCDGATK